MNLRYGINKNLNVFPGQFVRVTLFNGMQWTGSFIRIVEERGLKIAEFQTMTGIKRVGLWAPHYIKVLKQ